MSSRKQRGHSLLELMIVIGIALTVAAITAISLQPAVKSQHVDQAYNTTLNCLRRAHDLAAGDMRTYVVTFSVANPGVNGGTITAVDPLSGTTLFTEVLPPDVTFNTTTSGLPATNATTPDNFGSGSSGPFDFGYPADGGGLATIYFNPNGTATDAAGNTNNGVVYMSMPGLTETYRAVSLWGYTGRIRGWQLYDIAGTWTWQQQ
jgi:type II secretory pathway pseudopilin PulG